MSPNSPHRGAIHDLQLANVGFRDGIPYAVDFEDGYYGGEDGLAEARHVFLVGNDLDKRFASAGHVTIAETGFGTGLNCLAVMALLDRHRDVQIDFVSVERFPLDGDQMQLAHLAFPEIASHAAALRRALPPRWPGYHLVPLCDGRMTLHLHYGEIGDVLPDLDIDADAWFLDGFAPARNPGMWTPEILAEIGRLTRPGGTLASFTAAGHVRRGLEAAGFAIERRAGFGRKREMIRGDRLGATPEPRISARRVAVVGGGIAGAAVAAGLRRRGARPIILDAGNVAGSGASGNRMALQGPKLTVDHNAMSRLSVSCLSWASRLSDLAGATVGKGVLALDAPARLAARHDVFRTQQWPTDLMAPATADQQVPGRDHDGAVYHAGARVIRPSVLLAHLLADLDIEFGFAVSGMTDGSDGVCLHAGDGRRITADAVIIATGADAAGLLGPRGIVLPLEVTHGLVSQVPTNDDMAGLDMGVSFGGYLTPTLDGRHDLGATFWRDPALSVGEGAFAAGHEHNLALLSGALGAPFGNDITKFGSRISRRASLPDRRPIAGRIGDGVYILGALGARGFTLAPLLGDLLAADILGRPVPMPRLQRAGILPVRYTGAAD